MSIKNIGQADAAFKRLEFDDWTKKAEFKNLGVADAPSGLNKTDKSNQTFSDFLVDSMSEVNKLQVQANTAVERLASGKSKNIHETLLAVERADIAFRTMNQIRSKVLDAYKEVMRMQV
jgi:flagellar hook-basal body complex protein FliE